MTTLKLRHAALGAYALLALGLSVPRLVQWPALCIRGQECLEPGRTPAGPYRPDAATSFARVCGDLPRLANLPQYCDWRPERFQIDPWGYRNDRAVWEAEPDVLVYGDSFAFGQANTQEDTPSERLAARLGRPVYDGAGKTELEYLRWLFDHRRRPPARVLYLLTERQDHDVRELAGWDKKLDADSRWERWRLYWKEVGRYNPLAIVVSRLDKALLTPGLWPNRFEKEFPVYRLRDGRPILFLPETVRRYGEPRSGEPEKDAAFFLGLAQRLRSRGSRLTVLLVPEKYTVYAPLLADRPKPLAAELHLERVRRALKAAGVDAVDATPALLAAAAGGRTVYWSDDTHWNAEGIDVAMALVASRWAEAPAFAQEPSGQE